MTKQIKGKRNDFIHLHVHSRMSTADGLNDFEDIVKRVADIGQPGIAITDHYYMYDIPRFYYACKDQEIKPILGCELGIFPEGISATLPKYDLDDIAEGKKKNQTISYFHGLFLAKNETGYKNLMKLASVGSHENRFYRKPRVRRYDIKRYSEGLIFCSACVAGEIPKLILNNQLDYALKVIAWYHKIFKDDFYLEIQDHGLKDQEIVNTQLIKWAKRYNLNLVLTNDTHYTTKDMSTYHRLLLCANWGYDMTDKTNDVWTKYFPTDEFYIKDNDEMYAIAKKWDCIDAYENTYKIYEKCNVELKKETHYPIAKFHLTDDNNPDTELRLLIDERKWNKYTDKGDYVLTSTGDEIAKETFNARLKKELDDIKLGQVANYFLNVCYGITDYCEKNKILIGAGRGSAAGSVVSYILNITDIEPISLNLTWERFWNPGRMKKDSDGNILEISMPDIDIDVPSDRRVEVMEHCKEYFGEECVSNIITFGTYSGRNLITAVGKALNIDKDVIASCNTYVYFGLSDALSNNAFIEFLQDNEEANYLIEMCKPLEGCVKNASTHAAGMLICDSDMTNYTPYSYGKNGITSQYPFETLEKIGCLKVDLLGHEAEVVIDRACKYIKENYNVKIIPREIPIDDKKTFKMLQKCDVRGVPQIEKDWVLDIIRDVYPTELSHVIDLVTMIRPGSLDSGQTTKYRKIRKGELEAVPDIPQVEHITESTFHCWLYQEQVMDVTKDIAGFTLGQADDLRKVVAKTKYKDKAEKLMELFKKQSMSGQGKTEALTYEQWKLIDNIIRNFFKYAFNKAHSAGYGVTSYRCAYLKANYFIEYMTALLNSKANDAIPFYLDNIYEHGYSLYCPDINISSYEWTCEDARLRPPLSFVKGCGISAVSAIIEERELHGEYASFEDFLVRTPSNAVKVNVIKNLICAGAFDGIGYKRKTLWDALEEDYHNKIRKNPDLVNGKLLPKGGTEFNLEEIQEDEEYLMGIVISLSDKEIEKRRNKIMRRVRKYREAYYDNPVKFSSIGTSSKIKDNKKITQSKKKIMKIVSDTDTITETFIKISSNDKALISKIFMLVKKQNIDAERNYHVNFIVVSDDKSNYFIDTKLYINVDVYKQLSQMVSDNIWIE